jgi:hypothetical protein
LGRQQKAEDGSEAVMRNDIDDPPDLDQRPSDIKKLRSRVMYIENKSTGLNGPARIGRVYFSKTGKTIYYADKRFRSLKGSGFKANYYDVESGDHYWITGVKKRGGNRLYGGNLGVEIDDDVAGQDENSAQQGDAPEPASNADPA